MNKKYNSELQLQADCFQWHFNSFPEDRGFIRLIHNNARNAIQGEQLKAAGLTKGTPDMVWWRNPNDVYFEFKLPGNKQTEHQVETMNLLHSLNREYYLVESLLEYKIFVNLVKGKISL